MISRLKTTFNLTTAQSITLRQLSLEETITCIHISHIIAYYLFTHIFYFHIIQCRVFNLSAQIDTKTANKVFKKISQARCLLRLWLIMLISKRNQCAQGSSNSQQNCQCHLNIVIWAQIHTWNLSILVHHRIISDLTYLLLDHDVLYYALFEFYFRFTKNTFPPFVLSLLLPLVCKYCLHSSHPCQEV